MHSTTLRHTWEAAHRLPHLGGKCHNLHGHSWAVEVTITASALTEHAILVEFGAFKKAMRAWIDAHLDHGAMLGWADPLVPALRAEQCKIFFFGDEGNLAAHEGSWDGAEWPTVEAVAMLLAERAADWLQTSHDVPADACIERVVVTETATNRAEWRLDPPRGRHSRPPRLGGLLAKGRP